MRPFLHSFLGLFGVVAAVLAMTPRAEALQVVYEGAAAFPKETLNDAISDPIQTASTAGLSPATADDSAYFLNVWYRKQGYSQAEVTWEISNPETLVLKVNQGPYTRLGSVEFPGAKSIGFAQLDEYVIGTTRSRYSALKKEKELPFVESDVKAAVSQIRGLYQSEGFLNVVVNDPQVRFSSDQTRADVQIAIVEGTRYRFGKVTFGGDLVFFPPTPLLKALEPFTKNPYTPSGVAQMERQVVYFYKSRGYYAVKVTVQSDPSQSKNGEVGVHFQVESGDVYRFGKVTVAGLTRLKESFIQNRFRKLNGAFYNPEKLDTLFRELMRTGLFSRLTIDPKANPNREVDLHVSLEEAPAKEIGFSGGFGTFEGPLVGFSAADRDLGGRGRPLTSSIEMSARFFRGDILYVDPWLFESPYSLRARGFGISSDFPGYTQNELGVRTDLTRKFTDHSESGVFLQSRKANVASTGIDPVEIGPGNTLITSIGVTQTFDRRDSALNPRTGFIANISAELAQDVMGHDVRFGRLAGRFSYYVPIGRSMLAFGVRTGAIISVGSEDVPISERYFNGGSRSVRSYPERELGPKDINGYPIGGNAFSTFNIEYDFPLATNLDGAVFLDAGSIEHTWSDFPGELRSGIGVGIRYRLPVGPLRIDIAGNPAPGPDDPWGAFHFSFGFAF